MRLGIWHRGIDRLHSVSEKALQLNPLRVIAEEPFCERNECSVRECSIKTGRLSTEEVIEYYRDK
jgi:hypothetical protein